MQGLYIYIYTYINQEFIEPFLGMDKKQWELTQRALRSHSFICKLVEARSLLSGLLGAHTSHLQKQVTLSYGATGCRHDKGVDTNFVLSAFD